MGKRTFRTFAVASKCVKKTLFVNKQPVDQYLRNYISNDIHDRNIAYSVCDIYQRSNSTISDLHCMQ